MMGLNKLRRYVAAALLGVAGLVVPASAQFGGGGGGGGFQIDPAQARQLVLGNVQQTVGFTDEEWAAIGPKLWNVLSLQVDSGSGSIGGLVGGLRGRGGRGGGGISALLGQVFNNGQPSQVTAKRQELQAAVDDVNSAPGVLRLKLEEYRAAVKKAREQLILAQQDLVGLLTLRQEAALMEMGYLD